MFSCIPLPPRLQGACPLAQRARRASGQALRRLGPDGRSRARQTGSVRGLVGACLAACLWASCRGTSRRPSSRRLCGRRAPAAERGAGPRKDRPARPTSSRGARCAGRACRASRLAILVRLSSPSRPHTVCSCARSQPRRPCATSRAAHARCGCPDIAESIPYESASRPGCMQAARFGTPNANAEDAARAYDK
jgi:hypothetical protein